MLNPGDNECWDVALFSLILTCASTIIFLADTFGITATEVVCLRSQDKSWCCNSGP